MNYSETWLGILRGKGAEPTCSCPWQRECTPQGYINNRRHRRIVVPRQVSMCVPATVCYGVLRHATVCCGVCYGMLRCTAILLPSMHASTLIMRGLAIRRLHLVSVGGRCTHGLKAGDAVKSNACVRKAAVGPIWDLVVRVGPPVSQIGCQMLPQDPGSHASRCLTAMWAREYRQDYIAMDTAQECISGGGRAEIEHSSASPISRRPSRSPRLAAALARHRAD